LAKYRSQPPWEFLLTASRNTLQSYEFSRLNLAANLRKEIGSLLDQWMEENSAAMLARWLMEQRERSVLAAEIRASENLASDEDQAASDNFLNEPGLPSQDSHRRT
jgi:hypothetical protein